MSQLSFASFFDQAREAAPLTPAKPVLPTVNAQPVPHRMMTIDQARRQFISVFRDTARSLRRWEVFSDFITLAASELDMARIRTPENIEQSRKICAKYSESDISNLHTLFCLMVCALEAKFHDFLGAIFMELELGDDIMLVLIGGDIRPRVIDALQSLVGTIKNECVSEVEREA